MHENKYVNKKACRVGERPREGLGLCISGQKTAGSQYLFNGVKMERKRLVSVRMRRVDDGVWRFYATTEEGVHGVIARAVLTPDNVRLEFPHMGKLPVMFMHICQARRHIEEITGCRVRYRGGL
ncbi:hypothetical protein R455_003934 [Salmonella enterica subsp. enterica]|uniref:hypothetical protein n=1 Tax=Salmonella enterica TaxID=28901 RepID=UPI00128A94BF|nr:hypothetical protein [Salmonella enterica]ECH8734017.1 hypothetical protein [Salmonella enterica subsp. enterica serovar Wandsworth]EDV5349934.1 hypothetical protein [Salmonella enterica subsp. houtenae]EDT6629453.1 hypothetical protein [Salmonella enterica subsp. enterica serovar Wandsworth]EDT6698786.1 hypothetical protein [Salmonella enterica subsp. enterica serovar Wandsworth]EDT6702836.1 hypothetical protein [Salmonella enterica subsp. enterica serovar Wandsworth]